MTDQLKARPTIYNGIRMRSRLEAGFATWCDDVHFKWEYEPHAFGSGEGQYLPDFVLSDVRCSWLTAAADVIVEVKPDVFWDDEDLVAAARRRIRIAEGSYSSDVVLMIASPSRHDVYIKSADQWTSGAWVFQGRTPPPMLAAVARGPWPSEYWNLNGSDTPGDSTVADVLDRANLGTPVGRARAAYEAVEIVRRHPSREARRQLLYIAERCRVDPDRVQALFEKGAR